MIYKAAAAYDLLIIETPEKDNWASILFGTGRYKLAENATLRLTMKDA